MSSTSAISSILKELGLEDDQIEIYRKLIGRGPITIGEMALSTNLNFDQCKQILEIFVSKGIVRSIEGVPIRYQAIPPYEVFLRRFEKLDQEFDQIQEEVSKALTEGVDRMSKSFALLGDRIPKDMSVEVAGLDDVAKNLTNLLDEMLSTQISALQEKIISTLSESMGDIKSSFDKVGRKELKRTQAEFTQLAESIRERISAIGAEIDDAKQGLISLWQETKEAEYYRPKKLWFVPKRAGILSFFKDMISRAKHRVMLVAPLIRDVDPEMIKQLPQRVIVQIASYVDTNNRADVMSVKQLSDKGNVTVRNYDARDFWGVIVDDTETLLAAIPEDPNDPVNGIGCISDEYITVFRRLLADVWLASERLSLK
jgi:sugar-specific transcriptional regulator TrmB